MEKAEISESLKAYLIRRYCGNQPDDTLSNPAFLIVGSSATVFLGCNFIENIRLCRKLRNDGHRLSLRKCKMKEFHDFGPSANWDLGIGWPDRADEDPIELN